METKKVTIDEKEYTVKKLSLEEGLSLDEAKTSKERTQKLIEFAVTPKLLLSEISLKDGIKLIQEINEFNGLTKDFLLELGISQEDVTGKQNTS